MEGRRGGEEGRARASRQREIRGIKRKIGFEIIIIIIKKQLLQLRQSLGFFMIMFVLFCFFFLLVTGSQLHSLLWSAR